MESSTSDVFVSYSASDREGVRALVAALEDAGLKAWWDTRIAPGAGFDAEIQSALDGARCVLVVWSQNSVSSEWVITEANEGLERGVLVPVSIDGAKPPLAFRRRQTLEVSDPSTGAKEVVAAVRAVLDGGPIEAKRQNVRPPVRRSPWLGLGLLVLGLAVGVTSTYLFFGRAAEPPRSASSIRIPLTLEAWVGVQNPSYPVSSIAMSPSGDTLVYVDRDALGIASLRLRRLHQLESTKLPGTEGAEMPFFSFDGQWIGYVDDGVMKRISLSGGDPSIITSLETAEPWGASWGSDGKIVFAEVASALKSVPASGGKATALTELDASRPEYNHRLPHHVPGHSVLLFSVVSGGIHEVWALDLETGERRYLFEGISPHYASPGYIVFAKAESLTQGSLWSVPFDPGEMRVTGIPKSVQGAVAGREGSEFSLGIAGPIVYLPTQGDRIGELLLLDKDGTSRLLDRGPAFMTPAFSPDGNSIAVSTLDEIAQQSTLFIYEVASGSSRRISKSGYSPLWSPDGQAITFTKPGVGIVRHYLDGARNDEVLLPSSDFITANFWIDQGQTLVLTTGTVSDWDLYTLMPGGKPRLLIDHRLPAAAAITSDERWIAFCTWYRGVVVGTFPEVKSVTVPSKQGCNPLWDLSDDSLYYEEANTLWVVPATVGITVKFGERRFVADIGVHLYRAYDVDQTGRVVIARQLYTTPKPPVLFANWRTGLIE